MKWVVGAGTHGSWLGTYERAKMQRLASLVRPGDCVLDIGANVGLYALLASRLVGATGQVHAFEPVPRNAAATQRHFQLNRLTNVTLWETAVSDHQGQMRFQETEACECGYLSEMGNLDVEVTTLDALWREQHFPDPQIVKMDVEGAEVQVLKGGRELFTSCRPTILLAGHGSARQRECEQILMEYGYTVVIEKDGRADGMYDSLATPAKPDPGSDVGDALA